LAFKLAIYTCIKEKFTCLMGHILAVPLLLGILLNTNAVRILIFQRPKMVLILDICFVRFSNTPLVFGQTQDTPLSKHEYKGNFILLYRMHIGGLKGLFGLFRRYKKYFALLKQMQNKNNKRIKNGGALL
ncbi:hypothetical protein ACJX0J_017677, partial [Zea mays]